MAGGGRPYAARARGHVLFLSGRRAGLAMGDSRLPAGGPAVAACLLGIQDVRGALRRLQQGVRLHRRSYRPHALAVLVRRHLSAGRRTERGN